MYGGILELVFLFVVEDDAVVVDKVKDACLPQRARQELNHEVVLPFLAISTKVHPMLPARLWVFSSLGVTNLPPSCGRTTNQT